MVKKILILHIPVIHKGYLDFFNKIKIKGRVSSIYLIDEKLQEKLSEIKRDIASIDSRVIKELFKKMGFQNVLILSKKNIRKIKNEKIILVQDEISRNLYNKYLKGKRVEWESAFLRWDRSRVLAEFPAKNVIVSKKPFDLKMMKEAYEESKKSGDWWRQIGAVLVKGGKIVARSYNMGVPNDNTPYQLGSIRDLFEAGEKQEMSPTIHAEQAIVSEAAKRGIKLLGSSLYLTHYPCPLCAKLVAYSGIKKLYFSEGASNLDGIKTLKSANVKVIRVRLTKK